MKKKFWSILIVSFVICLLFSSFAYSQVNIDEPSQIIISKVGILTICDADSEINKISSTIEYIINHYLSELPEKFNIKSLSEKYKDSFSFNKENNNDKLIAFISEIAPIEGVDAVIVIGSSIALNSVVSNIIIIKPNKLSEDKIVYQNVFQIDKAKLEKAIPPTNVIKEIPNIARAILSVDLSIKTNANKSEIYINGKFISYAEPSIILSINIGVYHLRISADGYETKETELVVQNDESLFFTLEKKFFEKIGLSITGMLEFPINLFPENEEKIGLSTSYSFQFYFFLFNHGKFFLDLNLIIMNLTRFNEALFLGNTFLAEIDITSIAFLFNIRYEPVFRAFPWLSPTIGGGIGISSNSSTPRLANISDLCFNLIGGFSIHLGRTFSIIVEYRYIWFGEVRFEELLEIFFPTGTKTQEVTMALSGSLIFVGLRINL